MLVKCLLLTMVWRGREVLTVTHVWDKDASPFCVPVYNVFQQMLFIVRSHLVIVGRKQWKTMMEHFEIYLCFVSVSVRCGWAFALFSTSMCGKRLGAGWMLLHTALSSSEEDLQTTAAARQQQLWAEPFMSMWVVSVILSLLPTGSESKFVKKYFLRFDKIHFLQLL